MTESVLFLIEVPRTVCTIIETLFLSLDLAPPPDLVITPVTKSVCRQELKGMFRNLVNSSALPM